MNLVAVCYLQPKADAAKSGAASRPFFRPPPPPDTERAQAEKTKEEKEEMTLNEMAAIRVSNLKILIPSKYVHASHLSPQERDRGVLRCLVNSLQIAISILRRAR